MCIVVSVNIIFYLSSSVLVLSRCAVLLGVDSCLLIQCVDLYQNVLTLLTAGKSDITACVCMCVVKLLLLINILSFTARTFTLCWYLAIE